MWTIFIDLDIMANPGPKQCKHYEDGLDTCSPTKYKKIETFHTNDNCFYKKGTSNFRYVLANAQLPCILMDWAT